MAENLLLVEFLVLPIVFAVTLTAVVAPVLAAAFRGKVTASMNQAASMTPAAQVPVALPTGTGQDFPSVPGRAESARWPSGTPSYSGFGPLPRVPAAAALQASSRQEVLSRRARNTLWRLAIAYGCAGAAQAIVITLVVLLGGPDSYTRPSIWLSMLIVMALPVVPTIAYVLATRPVARALWIVVALGVALVFAGEARGLVWDAFLLYIMVPAVIFLLFNLRFWRATAPVVLVLSLGGSLGWLTFFEIGRAIVGASPVIWIFRLVGLATGVLLALRAVRGIGQLYRAKRTSEQMLFIDTWWSLLTVIQTAVLVITWGPEGFIALAGLGGYLLISRVLISGLRTDRSPAARLLLLRVFGHDRRTERLLDELTLRWRPFGTVDLIAGRDLALRNIDPAEFYDFLTGKLAREFVRDGADLDQRLARRDDCQDPDGRFRVNQFFCHRNTWKPTLDRLVASCDAVLMDLRNFNENREGCRYEIRRLAEHAGVKPIVLLTNANTQLDLAESLFREAATQHHRQATPDGQVFILQASRSNRATVDTATRLLLDSPPA
ncbi:MAG TPA: hypothetical protein VI094_18660 [Propionibacteriaceae bacterium]